ncbi:hypothetical protein CANMA_005374 [Candida margitis]|uniref:uncharacterized protein n=1 Tax=Candida margitis TaxID=1775924 RepID=UPI002227FA81|nr:uncharacterized protein CANMA_005374 [Candida margitis]KAI5950184.1 hypothetical protein CANMA_005374 [Candida margitis]
MSSTTSPYSPHIARDLLFESLGVDTAVEVFAKSLENSLEANENLRIVQKKYADMVHDKPAVTDKYIVDRLAEMYPLDMERLVQTEVANVVKITRSISNLLSFHKPPMQGCLCQDTKTIVRKFASVEIVWASHIVDMQIEPLLRFTHHKADEEMRFDIHGTRSYKRVDVAASKDGEVAVIFEIKLGSLKKFYTASSSDSEVINQMLLSMCAAKIKEAILITPDIMVIVEYKGIGNHLGIKKVQLDIQKFFDRNHEEINRMGVLYLWLSKKEDLQMSDKDAGELNGFLVKQSTPIEDACMEREGGLAGNEAFAVEDTACDTQQADTAGETEGVLSEAKGSITKKFFKGMHLHKRDRTEISRSSFRSTIGKWKVHK